jgi:hypothetical protein
LKTGTIASTSLVAGTALAAGASGAFAQEAGSSRPTKGALQQEGTNLMMMPVRWLTSRSRIRCSACKSS